jgi:hypothetical protein
MAGSARQVTVEELEQRFLAAKDVVERSHFQAIWTCMRRVAGRR